MLHNVAFEPGDAWEAEPIVNDWKHQDGIEPFEMLDLKGMLSLPPPKWLVKNFLPQHGLGLLFGESNTFKSFIAIDLCCHIAHGMPWCGKKVQQGAVLYIAGEGAHGAARLRFPAWHKHYGLMDSAPPIRMIKNPVEVNSAKDAKRLLASVSQMLKESKQHARLVIIDTLARSFGGDENSGDAMGKFLKGCADIQNTFGCLVLVVHHSGWGDKGRSRGHSSLWGAIDCRLKATSDPEALTACVEIERQKDGPSGTKHHMRGIVVDLGKDEDGEPFNSLVFKQADAPVETPKSNLSENETRLRDVLVQSLPNGCTYGEWLEKVQNLDNVKKMAKSSFNHAREALIEKGFVKQEGSKYFLDLTT